MIYYFPNRPILINPNSDLVDQCSNDENWIAETKHNGDRLSLIFEDKKFIFKNRKGELLKYSPSNQLLTELNALNLPDMTFLDGELMHNKSKTLKNTIFFYDVYVVNGNDVNDDLNNRRKILSSFFNDSKFNLISLTKQYNTGFRDIFNKIKDSNNAEEEGLVLKKLTGKLVFNTLRSDEVSWQYKIRKSTKNYSF